MSNPFYNYICELLIDNIDHLAVPGNRYYLKLDVESEVKGLLDALKSHRQTQSFESQLSNGKIFETVAVDLKEAKLVIAATADGITPDFLVTLRNNVGDQIGEWQNTALLSIVSKDLDSIRGGSSDLQKEGMPFHSQTLKKHLEERISTSSLSNIEKAIMEDHLNLMVEDHFAQQVTLLDFIDIFSILHNGEIANEDYKNLSLFKDEDLAGRKGGDIEKRLQANREMFDHVKRIHDFGNLEEDLERTFSDRGVKLLKQNNWEDTRYSEVIHAKQEKEEMDKNLKISLSELTIKGFSHWERSQKNTVAGNRKRQIIIFNPLLEKTISISAKFELSGGKVKSLHKDYLKVMKAGQRFINCEVKQKQIEMTILPEENQFTFINVAYKHDGKASLGAEFQIAIVPFEPAFLSDLETRFNINPSKKQIEITDELDELVIGYGFKTREKELTETLSSLYMTSDEKCILTPQPESYNEDDQLIVDLKIDNAELKLLLKNELPEAIPVRAFRIWQLKREKQQDFVYKQGKLVFGNEEYYLHAEYSGFLEWEKKWIEHKMSAAYISGEEIINRELFFNKDLKDIYTKFLQYFQNRRTTPTLSHISSEYREVATDYIQTYLNEITTVSQKGSPQERMDLASLGTLQNMNGTYLTPFHPLVVAYQLELNDKLKADSIDKSILERLKMTSLLPYLYNEKGEALKPDEEHSLPEWVKYNPKDQISISEAQNYLSKVVEDKINQFEKHFSYLFIQGAKSTLKINVLNIYNDHEVLRGILSWMTNKCKKIGIDKLNPVEVSLYDNQAFDSAFDLFSKIKTPEEVSQEFNLSFKSDNYDEADILRAIRENLSYYKHQTSSTENLSYAHLSFYKMASGEVMATQKMDEMISGVSLGGLLTSLPSMYNKGSYQSGFGTKDFPEEKKNLLFRTAAAQNELVANTENRGNNQYSHGVTMVSRTSVDDREKLDNVFDSSYWVTFVDPSVDLEFFQNYERSLVVIHYSDQYSSSSRYDAITVTNKSDQYFNVIKEHLQFKELEGSKSEVVQAIQAFNAFNGEWLLRIIGSKGHFDREKFSILSGIKYALSYFDHEAITWVPISLEEVLRVAGAYGLTKSGAPFSAKNLGVRGSYSDDVLLIGLEKSNNKPILHFYPLEVKIGWNQSSVIDKAKKQLKQTYNLIMEKLTDVIEDEAAPFEKQFYRQFFIQLYLANLNKLIQSNFWEEKYQDITGETRYKLLSDQVEISGDLKGYIGEGAIVSFEKDGAPIRRVETEETITILRLTENDGTSGIIESVQNLRNSIENNQSDLSSENTLANQYKLCGISGEKKQEGEDHFEEDAGPEGPLEPEESPQQEEKSLEDVRVLIGKAEGSNQQIYWEYGNKELSNRHLLISGKSGQGKTYFMQCLLYELASQGISSIVVDYTEGFLPNQLEEEFNKHLNGKINHMFVIRDKLPINPFKINEKDLGGFVIEENETDVAERIKSVFSAVYPTLGIQQLNAIYEATKNGVEKYLSDMSLPKLAEELEALETSYASKTLSQIRSFIDRNPFEVKEEELDWGELINSNGTVNVIQLTGYPRDVQLMITEFLLWDLWNYSILQGNKDIPIPVVMDEAQNLDHRQHSPSARILTEGRKFGWSGWYATQFLRSQLDAGELARLQNAAQKIYFAPPEQEIGTIANSLVNEQEDKRKWERKLSSLRKGQCIVQGPMQDGNHLTKPTANIVNISAFEER